MAQFVQPADLDVTPSFAVYSTAPRLLSRVFSAHNGAERQSRVLLVLSAAQLLPFALIHTTIRTQDSTLDSLHKVAGRRPG